MRVEVRVERRVQDKCNQFVESVVAVLARKSTAPARDAEQRGSEHTVLVLRASSWRAVARTCRKWVSPR